MRAFLAVAIFLLVGVAIGAEENGAMGTSKNMENFRIDLSVRPQDRWNEVVDAYHDQVSCVLFVLFCFVLFCFVLF